MHQEIEGTQFVLAIQRGLYNGLNNARSWACVRPSVRHDVPRRDATIRQVSTLLQLRHRNMWRDQEF